MKKIVLLLAIALVLVPTAMATNYYGTDNNDSLNAGPNADGIWGYGGNDVLQGNGGDDFLSGGAGLDSLLGGSGDDELQGDADTDWLYGGDGADYLEGWTGSDEFHGEAGNDEIHAYDTYSDTIECGSGTDVAYINSSDTFFAGHSCETIITL